MDTLVDLLLFGFLVVIAACVTLWMAGAIYYDVFGATRWGQLATDLWLMGVIVAFALWSPRWQPFVSLLAVMALVLLWWFRQQPSHVHDWHPSVAILPRATCEGESITIENLRNFEYRSLEGYTPGYETRIVRLVHLRGVDIIFFNWESAVMSHPLLVFDFGPDGRVCISIEVRYRNGQEFSIQRSHYRQQELIFVVTDERDSILRRTKFSKPPEAHLYCVIATGEELRGLFMDFVQAINDLHVKPRWYHGLFANCTTSFYCLPSSRIRWDWRVIVNARLDRELYEIGRLDQSLSFADLRRVSYLNEIAYRAPERMDSGTISVLNLKGAAMNAELLALFKVHAYFRGVPEEVTAEVLDLGNVTNYAAGDLVHEPNSPLDMVGFVLAGRLKATRLDARGHESLFWMIERGDRFGIMVGALAEPIPIRHCAFRPLDSAEAKMGFLSDWVRPGSRHEVRKLFCGPGEVIHRTMRDAMSP